MRSNHQAVASALLLALSVGTAMAAELKPADFKPMVSAGDMAPGPFQPTDVSLATYRYPAWFRDAKFGIWAHWGPQAVPRMGDWYAKKLYEQRSGKDKNRDGPFWKFHLEHYGHPSKVGYKDIIPLWKAEKWDPQQLMSLYKKAGAKYFVSMGTHHDNFFLWASKLHRWNAAEMGPKKDVVGLWQQAAKKEGLRFGVSEHLGASYTWYQPAHGSDLIGPLTGVPYDGNDPQYEDLYHRKAAADDHDWLTKDPANQREWFDRIRELVDLYHPDLLYSDSKLPFGDVGRTLVAHYYNQDLAKNSGTLQAVYNCKEPSNGRFVTDLERGVMDSISPYPWQTDTSIGDWFYRTGQKYKSSGDVVHMLVDIVSKNGNLLINVVQTPEGDIEPDMLATLTEIGAWTAVHGEGIYGSRPWKVYGEKPADAPTVKSGNFNEGKVPYSAKDIRFTTQGETLYAFCLGEPQETIRMVSLGKSSTLAEKPVASVELVGSSEKVAWTQEADALVIPKPMQTPSKLAVAYRITFAK